MHTLSICAIFKNEAQFLAEWIEYHKLIGVEHFYLYNNNSEDNFRDVLLPYLEFITLNDWPLKASQMQAYKHHCVNHSKQTEWTAFIDIDEFIVVKDGTDLKEYLGRNKDKFLSLTLPWVSFCSGGREETPKGLVTKIYTETNSKFFNQHVKSICQAKYIDEDNINSPHLFNFKPTSKKYSLRVQYIDRFQLFHYKIKSKNHIRRKFLKGDVWYPRNSTSVESQTGAILEKYDTPDSTNDYILCNFVPQLEKSLYKKTIYFCIDPAYGSSYLRGLQVCFKLRELGYKCEMMVSPLPDIKDSVIFFIKNCIRYVDQIHPSNFIVWDVIDYINTPQKIGFFKYYTEDVDLVIFHNEAAKKEFKTLYNFNKPSVVIPHHWDVRLKNVRTNFSEFRLGYIGDSSSSILLNLVENKELITGATKFTSDDFVSIFSKYNCLFDIKDPQNPKFKTCSAIKLSTAAALGIPAILNKTWSNIELLPDSILYCENTDEKTVQDKITEIKSLYGTSEWESIIETLQDVKEKTDLDNIIKLYLKIIHDHSEN